MSPFFLEKPTGIRQSEIWIREEAADLWMSYLHNNLVHNVALIRSLLCDVVLLETNQQMFQNSAFVIIPR